MTELERWRLVDDGRVHEVTLRDKDLRREIRWEVDGAQVDVKVTSDERVVLTSDGHGAVGVRVGAFGPARRVTWWAAEEGPEAAAVRAFAGVGGTDLEAVGGRAKEREEWIRAHPRAFAARRTLAAAAKVVLPILLVWLLARVALPAIPWPDIRLPSIPWPQIPWPDIPWPSIPWPDIPWPDIRLPSIPWPDWQVPAWVRQVAEVAKYVVPVLVAAVLARAELRRRHKQDEERRRRAEAEQAADGGRAV